MKYNIKENTFENSTLITVMDWIDFKTKEVKGVKVVCGNLETFEKFEVRIKDFKKEDIQGAIERGDKVKFIDPSISTWFMNGKAGATVSAVAVEKG